MTTQPATRCDPIIFDQGVEVCILAGCSTAIEAVVVRVRESMGVTLDWHYMGGRACVLTLDPPERHEAIRAVVRLEMPIWLSPATPASGDDVRPGTRFEP